MKVFKIHVQEINPHPAATLAKALEKIVEDEELRLQIMKAFGAEVLAGTGEQFFGVRRLTFHDRKELEALATVQELKRARPNEPGERIERVDPEQLSLLTLAFAIESAPEGYEIEPPWPENTNFTPGVFDFGRMRSTLDARAANIRAKYSYEETAWLYQQLTNLNVFNSGRIEEIKKVSSPGGSGTEPGADQD